MKEQLHTIPVNEGFDAGDECPFCFMKRQAEQRVIRYVAGPGASYMEPDVREETNKVGFCPSHLKILYDYGNNNGGGDMMKRTDDVKIPFPVPPFGFGGIISGTTSFDPLGSYTGRTPERNEIPVQDADDL